MKRLIIVGLTAVAMITLSGAGSERYSTHNPAAYADPSLVSFVRPGLAVQITGATIGADGTITASYAVTDPKGLPLDVQGVSTPGSVSTSFVAAYVPKGTSDWDSLVTAVQTSPITGNSANQPAPDSGGTVAAAGNGYTYTFRTKVPGGFDRSQTVRIGVYASRDLSEFELGTNYANSLFTFAPDGSTVADTPDMIATASCNRCHDPLSAHGGSRRLVGLCVMCHNPGGNGVDTVDPDTGNSVDFKVLVHKIHMGSSLPSVQAGKPYRIIGYRQAVEDYSNVEFPADARNCQMCHVSGAYPRYATVGTAGAKAGLPPASLHVDGKGNVTGGSDEADAAAAPAYPGTGDATSGPAGTTAIGMSNAADPGQRTEPAPVNANWWLTKPSTAACGACHDNVNFQSGENHAGGLPAFDSQCAQCHVPLGELPLDASILGAHAIPEVTPGMLPGVNFKLISASGAAGSSASVTFSILDNAGSPIDPKTMDLLSLVLAGPAAEYTGVVSEDATSATPAGPAGTYSYTFKAVIPANATGSFTVGIEGYRNYTVLPGTAKARTVRDVGFNQILPFAVGGSNMAPPPVDIAQQNCNTCHYRLSAHGGIRQNVQYCLLCHNPNATDADQRPASQSPPQSIDFPVLIHRLHTGETAEADGQMTPFVIYGFRGSKNDFSDVRYPADLRDCGKCHVNSSDSPPVPAARVAVNNPRAYLNPTPPTTAACTACHTALDASAHASAMTSPVLGESCAVCHGQSTDFSVNKVHARTL